MDATVLELDLVEQRVPVWLARRDDILEHVSNWRTVVDDPLTVLNLLASVIDIGHLRHTGIPVEVEVVNPSLRLRILTEIGVSNILRHSLGIELTIGVGFNPSPVRKDSPLHHRLERSPSVLVEIDTVILLLNRSGLDDHHGIRVISDEQVPKTILIPRLIRVELKLELTVVIGALSPVQRVEVIRNFNKSFVVMEEREEQLHQIPL